MRVECPYCGNKTDEPWPTKYTDLVAKRCNSPDCNRAFVYKISLSTESYKIEAKRPRAAY